jgi:hypothetical protein
MEDLAMFRQPIPGPSPANHSPPLTFVRSQRLIADRTIRRSPKQCHSSVRLDLEESLRSDKRTSISETRLLLFAPRYWASSVLSSLIFQERGDPGLLTDRSGALRGFLRRLPLRFHGILFRLQSLITFHEFIPC